MPEPGPQRAVVNTFLKGNAQGVRIFGRHKQTRVTMIDHLGGSEVASGGDDWQSGCHCFAEHIGEAFVTR